MSSIFSNEDVDRLTAARKESEAAIARADKLDAERKDLVAEIKQLKADLQDRSEEASAEKAAHTGTRSKISALQEKAALVPELERKLDSALSDKGHLESESEKLKARIVALEEDLGGMKGNLRQTQARAKLAEEKLESFANLADALRAQREAGAVIAAETGRLLG